MYVCLICTSCRSDRVRARACRAGRAMRVRAAQIDRGGRPERARHHVRGRAQRRSWRVWRRAWSRACDARGLVSGCWPRVQVRAQKSPVECGFGLTGVCTLRYGVANAPKPHCADFSRVAGVRGRAGRENRRYRPKVLRDARYAARLPPLMVPGEPTACPYAALWLAQSRPGRLAGCG